MEVKEVQSETASTFSVWKVLAMSGSLMQGELLTPCSLTRFFGFKESERKLAVARGKGGDVILSLILPMTRWRTESSFQERKVICFQSSSVWLASIGVTWIKNLIWLRQQKCGYELVFWRGSQQNSTTNPRRYFVNYFLYIRYLLPKQDLRQFITQNLNMVKHKN